MTARGKELCELACTCRSAGTCETCLAWQELFRRVQPRVAEPKKRKRGTRNAQA